MNTKKIKTAKRIAARVELEQESFMADLAEARSLRKVMLSVDVADLATIDAAAKAAGENRSEFMMKAALMRAGDTGSLFSEAERKELQLAMRWEALRVVAEFTSMSAKATLKITNPSWV